MQLPEKDVPNDRMFVAPIVDELHITVDETPVTVIVFADGDACTVVGDNDIVGTDKLRLLASFLDAALATTDHFRRGRSRGTA